MDEKYICYSHKGTQIEDIKPKKRGTPASKRGLSNEQVCLLTAVQRLGISFLRAYNMAKPTTEDINQLKEHVKEKSYVWTDGLASYHELIKEKECAHKVVKDYTEYDQVNHLNNVNSFHSKIEAQYQRYKGVATKYINRYAALFNFQREYSDMDTNEYLLLIKRRLKKKFIYFFIREIRTKDLFICSPY